MPRQILALTFVLSLGGLATAQDKDKAAHLFGPDKLWTAHLEIAAADWKAMHPSRNTGTFGVPPPPAEDAEKDKAEAPVAPPRGGFGFDFTYVKGTFEFDGQKWTDVGVRFKGNSSYAVSAQGLKRPFKIDFNRYVKGQEFHGLQMINLANNALDPSQLRESLAYSVFRACGVPASRTAFVELFLTVPGIADKEPLGLYTLIEEVDKTFLKNHFTKGKGLLVKPEGIQGLPYLGPDWKSYEGRYRPKDEPDAREQERLIAFTRLVNFADDTEFNAAIDKFLNVDVFLRYLAVCSVTVNLDSFVALGHNYNLYLNPTDNRFVIVPWDLNHSFGGLTMLGNAEVLAQWGVKKPYAGSNRLVQRLLAVKKYQAAYLDHVRELAKGIFTAEKLLGEVEQMQKAVQKVLDREAQSPKNQPTGTMAVMMALFGGTAPDLKTFIGKRAASVAAQVEGKSEGKELAGFGGQGARTGLGSQMAKPILTAGDGDKDGKLSVTEATDLLKRLFQDCDKDKKGVVDEKALAQGIARAVPPRPAGLFGLAPAGRNPAAPGIGVHVAGFLFHKGRTKVKDGRLALEDLLTVGDQLFRDTVKAQEGFLSEKELAEGLNSLSPSSVAPFGQPPPPRQEAGGRQAMNGHAQKPPQQAKS